MRKLIYYEFEQAIEQFHKPINKEDLSRKLLKAGLKEAEYNCVDLIDKHQLSKIRRIDGGVDVNKDIVAYSHDEGAEGRAAKYFHDHVLPGIGKRHYLDLISRFTELIQSDTFINPKKAAIYIQDARNAEDEIVSMMNMGSATKQEREAKALKEEEASTATANFVAKVFIHCIQQKREINNTLPLAFHNLMSQNPKFTGRTELLQKLSENFWNGSHVQILSGMPGVGKTQTALQFAYQHIHKYSVIWWINAESETSILESCNAYLYRKQIPNVSDTAQNFCDFFNQYENCWLLIYDNAELSSTNRKQMLDRYMPKNRENGNILITSRCGNDSYGVSPINLDVFTPHEAVGFIRSNLEKSQIKGDKYLAKRLGFLPLALNYAVAYIKQTPSYNCTDYLKRLSNEGIELFEISDDIGLDYYKKTVRATFMISIEEFTEKSKNGDKFMSAVLEFIYATAYFPSNNIDLNLIASLCDNFPPSLNEILHTPSLFDKLIRILINRSLYYVVAIPTTGDDHEYNDLVLGMHRLFQEILINELPPIFPREWNKIYYPFPYKVELKAELLLPETLMGELGSFTDEDPFSLAQLLRTKIQCLRYSPGAMKHTIGIIDSIEKILSHVVDCEKTISLRRLVKYANDYAMMGTTESREEFQNYSHRFLYLYVDFLRIVIRTILLNDGHLIGLGHLDEYDEELAAAIIDVYARMFFVINTPGYVMEEELTDDKLSSRILLQNMLSHEAFPISCNMNDQIPGNMMELMDALKKARQADSTDEM